MSARDTSRRPWILAIFLIVAGALGWLASFELTLDKFAVLENPDAVLSCDVSPLVQCGKNLESAQGAIFGFPNPLIGLSAFIAPIAVGVALLAGARFSRWFWALFNLGILAALVLVVWLISQSIFVLLTLCIWCMLVWSVTIPLFLAVTLRNMAEGVFGPGFRRFGRAARAWVIPATLACYLAVVVIAQLRLDALSRILGLS